MSATSPDHQMEGVEPAVSVKEHSVESVVTTEAPEPVETDSRKPLPRLSVNDKARNRRLFGNVLSSLGRPHLPMKRKADKMDVDVVLKQPRTAAGTQENQLLDRRKRPDIENMTEEHQKQIVDDEIQEEKKQRIEPGRATTQTQELHQKRLLERKKREEERQRRNQIETASYLRTKSTPVVVYLPKMLSVAEQKIIDRQLREVGRDPNDDD